MAAAYLVGRRSRKRQDTVVGIVRRLVAIADSVEGSSTAACIRQTLAGDFRPVLFDEAECSTDAADSRLQEILELIMVASSELGQIAKGTAGQIAISSAVRSCFCLRPAFTGHKGHYVELRRVTA
jgi:hypothetical protein